MTTIETHDVDKNRPRTINVEDGPAPGTTKLTFVGHFSIVLDTAAASELALAIATSVKD